MLESKWKGHSCCLSVILWIFILSLQMTGNRNIKNFNSKDYVFKLLQAIRGMFFLLHPQNWGLYKMWKYNCRSIYLQVFLHLVQFNVPIYVILNFNFLIATVVWSSHVCLFAIKMTSAVFLLFLKLMHQICIWDIFISMKNILCM